MQDDRSDEGPVCTECSGPLDWEPKPGLCDACAADVTTPDEDDAFIDDSRTGRCDVSYEGRHLGTRGDMDAAVCLLAAQMKADGYFPNVWHVNDHGNTTLLAIDADTCAWSFTETAYV